MSLNTDIHDKLVDRAAMTRLYTERLQQKIDKELFDHVIRLDDLVKNNSQKKWFALIDEELLNTYHNTYKISRNNLLDFVNNQISYAYQVLETNIGEVWRTNRPTRKIADSILDSPLIENTTLEAGWAGISRGERIRIEQIIRQGISEGLSEEKIALNIRKGNVHNISRNQSKGLVITATTAVNAQADHAVYEANKEVLYGWQYVAVLDSRTTLVCRHRDGKIFPVGDRQYLPPSHYRCRSTTVPIVKSYDDLLKLDSIDRIRKRNLKGLSKEQIAVYDGLGPIKESYHQWLLRQPQDVQYKHLGDYKKVEEFNSGRLQVDKFNSEGKSIGLKELQMLTSYNPDQSTMKFAIAKAKLDAMRLGVTSPDDFDDKLRKTLVDYYKLQATDLDGTLSLTNYRGQLLQTKKATKKNVLNNLPTEAQMIFNPITKRYEDTRIYQPNFAVFERSKRLIEEDEFLKTADKVFINKVLDDLEDSMGYNERSVVADNLRIIFSRYRKNPEPWGNFKAVVQSQIKFDVMNISEAIETNIRRDSDLLKKLEQYHFIDPVLGNVTFEELSENLIPNIIEKNKWEDFVAPKVAKRFRGVFNRFVTQTGLPINIRQRLSEKELQKFYLKFVTRLATAETPDFDQLAVALGRDLYNAAGLNGTRTKWHALGKDLLEQPQAKKLYALETFGVQKRRMRSKNTGAMFGPYYDTLSYNIRVLDKDILKYQELSRKIDVGLRVGNTDPNKNLIFRPGYKTYFVDRGILGMYDTRIPITSTKSFREFPAEFVDKDMADALNWFGQSQFKIDNDFYDFMIKMLNFKDDRGKAAFYDDLNEYRKYMRSRGDSYERLKMMEWLRKKEAAFSNNPFIDHRARIYDRGFIGPQAGETFRPYLNTTEAKVLGVEGYQNLQGQIGAFLGGLDDYFEDRYDSLTIIGRQKVAEKWRPDLIEIGNLMLSAKPNDIRKVLEHPLVHRIDGEELGKFMRFALEEAKIDNHLKAGGTLLDYKTALALEQDA